MRDSLPGFEAVVPFEESFDAACGLELDDDSAVGGRMRGRLRVVTGLLTQAGFVNGGVLAAVAEALASRGTALAVVGQGKVALGLSNDTSVLCPIDAGTIYSEAGVVGRHRDIWLWDVEHRDDAGALCALSRATIAAQERLPRI